MKKIVIDKIIQSNKIPHKTLERILTAKISEKNTLEGFRGNTYSKNIRYKFFFVFPIYKRSKYKNGSNIS